MNAHFRDTVFGQMIRLLPQNRLLKFPDELDRTLSERCIRKSDSTTQSSRFESGNIREHDNVVEDGDAGEKAEAGKSVCLVDWYDLNDPENPHNWSSGYKLWITFQMCLLNFGIYIGSSIYTPGERNIMEEFDVSEVVATLGLSLFVLGYGLGPMLFSPMSEMPTIGRRGIYFWTLLIFVLLQLPTGYAAKIEMLLVFRFLSGFFGGPVLAIGGATIFDIYSPADATYFIGIFGACGILGPVFGPLVGGFAAQAKGWRWTIWELAWLCTVILVMLFFSMPETSASNILYRRATRMRKTTGDPELRSQSEVDSGEVGLKETLSVLGRAFTLTFLEPVVFFVDLYCALMYGILYIWFESFPLVFGNLYEFNIGQQGLVFLGIFVGGVITLPCYLLWIRKNVAPQFNKPPVNPEIILPPTFLGAVSLPICLFWYGWTARGDIHWMVPLVGSGSFTISIITLFMPLLSYLGMSYQQYSASVLAGNALFRASCGVIFPLFARALFINLGIGPGNSLLGGLSILFIPIPFILFYKGERIRHWSKKATF